MKRFEKLMPVGIAILTVVFVFLVAYVGGTNSGEASSISDAVLMIDSSELKESRSAISSFPSVGTVQWKQPRFNLAYITFTGTVEDMNKIVEWGGECRGADAEEIQADKAFFGKAFEKNKISISGSMPGALFELTIGISREFVLNVRKRK